ncbi:MAG TPA: NDP-sugar synthase [Acidobacteriota bacterium]|nr:NDP-sugar synthase [Acidobacteriota bacterium]
MSGVTKALILLGGDSGELLPLTAHTPKPLLPVGNLPLLLFQLQRLKDAGVTEVVLSLSYFPRKIRSILEDGSRFGMLIRYRVESQPMGTAGAVKLAETILEGTTVVINGDVLTEHPLDKLLKVHARSKASLTIGTCRATNPQAYGIVEVGAKNRIKGFIERPRGKQVRTNRINAGIYLVEPEVLERIPKDEPSFFETDIFPALLEEGSLDLLASDVGQDWLEVTRPAAYLQSNMLFLEGKIAPPRFAAFQRPHQVPAQGSVEVDEASCLDEKCVLKKGARVVHSVIGANCRIEEGAFIRNSVLWPGCRIQKEAVISGAVLGRGCQIGERAFVGSGSILGDKSTVTAYSRL